MALTRQLGAVCWAKFIHPPEQKKKSTFKIACDYFEVILTCAQQKLDKRCLPQNALRNCFQGRGNSLAHQAEKGFFHHWVVHAPAVSKACESHH